jgi:hypothetical protein
MPFCIRNYTLEDEDGKVVYKKEGNYQTRNTIQFDQPLKTKKLTLRMEAPAKNIPASLFEIRCYGLNLDLHD